MSFYQSDLRKYINKEIYKKPTFETTIAGKKYFGIVKSQRRLGKTLNWYMIHGIQWVDLMNRDKEFAETVKHIRRDFGASRGDIYFQFWFLDEKETILTADLKGDEKKIASLLKEKEKLNKKMRERYEMVPSRREHMPDTTVKIDISQGIQETRRGYSKSGKRYINKAKKEDLSFVIAEKRDRWRFRDVWYTMAYDKGFAIIAKEQFLMMMEYLTQENLGRLMLAKKWGTLVSGSVILENERQWDTEALRQWGVAKWSSNSQKKKELIYLYGATNREFGNIWGHYRLKDQIMKWGADHHYRSLDLLGVAPPGNDKHYLSGVSRFKQAFGGETIISSGNYDLVFNSKLYRLMQVLKK